MTKIGVRATAASTSTAAFPCFCISYHFSDYQYYGCRQYYTNYRRSYKFRSHFDLWLAYCKLYLSLFTFLIYLCPFSAFLIAQCAKVRCIACAHRAELKQYLLRCIYAFTDRTFLLSLRVLFSYLFGRTIIYINAIATMIATAVPMPKPPPVTSVPN